MGEPLAEGWPKGRLVAHPTPGLAWIQVPHRNDIGHDWIEVDLRADLADVLAAARKDLARAWDEGASEALRMPPHLGYTLVNPYRTLLHDGETP